MKNFLIEPRDPLIARDGRPSALGRFESLAFPLPSTIAGAARTRMASAEGIFDLGPEQAARLLELAVHGPLMVWLDETGQASLYAPAPRDAVVLKGEGGDMRRYRLAPLQLPAGCYTDAPERLEVLGFASGGWERIVKEKAFAGAPSFWPWTAFESWLTAPADEDVFPGHELGLGELVREARTHLAIENGERVAVEGALFATEGLRFLQLADPERCLAPFRLGLSFRAEDDGQGEMLGRPLQLRQELAPLGGERRLARWMPQESSWPALNEAVRCGVVEHRRCRVFLLTPGIFAEGALPRWNGTPFPGHPGVVATVKAAALPRAAVVSGWDLRDGKPKPTRRLAAAGSVYFLELDGRPEDLEGWCESVWLRPVSDEEQDRRDGFGLAALGVWP